MARQVALAIGVASVPKLGLPLLAGVQPGIQGFCSWAKSQGFAVRLLTDSKRPVVYQAVYKAIDGLVAKGDVERLFVFFSGHGYAGGVGEDYWLLSDAGQGGIGAVNVLQSVQRSRFCGISHVAFFADACRTAPSLNMMSLASGPIFPDARIFGNIVEVDQFYATVPGDPAFDKTAANGSAAFGVFTRCLLRGLGGEAEEAVSVVTDGPSPRAVLSYPLARYLLDEVRLEADREAGVTQTPDCIPGSSWKPNAIAWVTRAPLTEDSSRPSGEKATLERLNAQRSSLETELAESSLSPAPGRSHFETGVGMSVIGASVEKALLTHGDEGVFWEEGAWQVRARPGHAGAALLLLGEGAGTRWAASAVVPGFVTTLTVGEEGVINTSFVRIGNDPDVDRSAIAAAAAAFQLGRLDFIDETAMHRLLMDGNPSATILASYAMARLGQWDRIRELVDRSIEVLGVVPFDVASLAGETEKHSTALVTTFPLMRMGWTLGLSSLLTSPRLERGAWCTFSDLSNDEILLLVGD